MAKYAYRFPNGTKNDRVDAAELPLHGNGVFYCTTPGCQAKMHVRNPQKNSACFVSYDVGDHTGGILCHLKDKFRPDHYEEKEFSLNNFFDNILEPVEHEVTPHYGHGGVGGNRGIAINTLKMLYLMCLQYRDGGTYNGFLIDDILVDQYDFQQYSESGIIGNHIVACTFWKYDPSSNSIFMNCPDEQLPKGQHRVLKVHVENDKMFKKCVNKLYDKSHLHISVIAANWFESSDRKCMSECELSSVGKQICKGD